jgi:hypothetical protein
MFGIRLAVDEVHSGRATTAATLGPILVQRSGLSALRDLISRHFAPRARVLQARSGLTALRSIARTIRESDPTVAADIERRVEQIEATTVEFAQVRAAHLVGSGAVVLAASERADLDRLLSGQAPSLMVGLDASATSAAVRTAALAGIGRWRTLASDPLADPTLVEVCDVAARTLEHVYAGTTD